MYVKALLRLILCPSNSDEPKPVCVVWLRIHCFLSSNFDVDSSPNGCHGNHPRQLQQLIIVCPSCQCVLVLFKININ